MKCDCSGRLARGFWFFGLSMVLGLSTWLAGHAEEFTQKPSVAPAEVREETPAQKKTKTTKPDTALKTSGPKPTWIWGPDHDTGYTLTKEFEAHAKSAMLVASCDNEMQLLLNGKSIARSTEWQSPVAVDVQKHLKPGKNVLTAKVRNHGGVAGFAAKLIWKDADGKPRHIITDKTWKIADNKNAALKTAGKMGVKPWGDVFSQPASGNLAGGKRGVFHVLPGFQVELLYSVPKEDQGSWVSLTTDDKGRLIASDQGNKGLYRITPPPIGSDEPTRVQALDAKISAAQGMLHAFGSLYVSVNGGPGSGFYRLRDTNKDDQYDEVTKLKALQGGGEHGPHSIRLSPDGKSLYVIAGNHTNPPQDFDGSRLPSNWSEDLLLPRQWDARGHARGKLAPGGWIAKTDPDGKTWEMISSGYRNSYDMDLNADGELFAYDADMEWDMGMPWYRPTRVVHAVSGSEFGWRSGTGKWPTYYPDSVPPMINIGPGSPVGVTFGYGTKFPAKYQKALYILDWTFGTIYALHLKPEGASYTATKEEFLSRTPLPLTDATVGSDGALYFTVGGRGTQSELYRVTYVGKESTAPVDAKDETCESYRSRRRFLEYCQQPLENQLKLEEFPQKQFNIIWFSLDDKDRFIRYAARVALEHRDPARVHKELESIRNGGSAWTIINAAIALARQGKKSDQPLLLKCLDTVNLAFDLTKEQKLALLRAYALTFIRLGEPTSETASKLAKQFDEFYPAKDRDLNRELCRVLVYLKSPTVIDKTLKLLAQESQLEPADIPELLKRSDRYGGTIAKMLANQPDRQKIFYAFLLRNMKYGWTLGQRKAYLKFLDEQRQKSGGASFQGFLDNMRKDFLDNASQAERVALKSTIAETQPKPQSLPKAIGPGKDWKLDQVLAFTQNGLSHRNFKAGKRAYAASRCVLCHRFGGEGGATGPDLTNLAGRFSFKDLTESIMDPSKVISDQYRASKIQTTSGQVLAGRIVNEADGVTTIVTDPEDATKVTELKESEIEAIVPSQVSLMPKDLLKPLNKEEILDLLAYLQSRGNPNDPMFGQGSETKN